MLLSTGNKSELALGYCTLYGDTNGGLAVIGDVLKTEVYELARLYNREREFIPPSIIDKRPSGRTRAADSSTISRCRPMTNSIRS